ncbi:recombinase family protein [Spiribacter insolitus]|uniref:Recombinase family protein n=1 Tax=Spiribacter insolitus TaxID=3122417 RepID=A0ABV3T4D1_9GAMM
MMIRAYLRASTTSQDADRARTSIEEFVASKGHRVAAWYSENASGRTSDRTELRRLLDDSHPGDVLLVEGIDRLTRLPSDSWRTLRQEIEGRGVRVVSLDLPSTHVALSPDDQRDELSARILEATNGMLLEVIAAQAAADYETRRRRQAQGIEKAKRQGKYRGRQIDQKLHDRIVALLKDDLSVRKTADLAGCSPGTVQRVKKRKGSLSGSVPLMPAGDGD